MLHHLQLGTLAEWMALLPAYAAAACFKKTSAPSPHAFQKITRPPNLGNRSRAGCLCRHRQTWKRQAILREARVALSDWFIATYPHLYPGQGRPQLRVIQGGGEGTDRLF